MKRNALEGKKDLLTKEINLATSMEEIVLKVEKGDNENSKKMQVQVSQSITSRTVATLVEKKYKKLADDVRYRRKKSVDFLSILRKILFLLLETLSKDSGVTFKWKKV